MRIIARNSCGFTLFEALIYIALFAIIISGGIISAFNIFEGSSGIQAMAEREVELNFVLRKLDWLLSGADALDIAEPDIDETGSILRVLKDGDVYDLTLDSGSVVIITDPEGAANEFPLTSSRLDITTLSFTRTNVDSDTIAVTLTVDGDVIGPIKRFVR
jgi:hypothetical protein